MKEATITIPEREYRQLREIQRASTPSRTVSSQPQMSAAERYAILKKTAGALRGRLPKDLVAWQRRIRAEWD